MSHEAAHHLVIEGTIEAFQQLPDEVRAPNQGAAPHGVVAFEREGATHLQVVQLQQQLPSDCRRLLVSAHSNLHPNQAPVRRPFESWGGCSA